MSIPLQSHPICQSRMPSVLWCINNTVVAMTIVWHWHCSCLSRPSSVWLCVARQFSVTLTALKAAVTYDLSSSDLASVTGLPSCDTLFCWPVVRYRPWKTKLWLVADRLPVQLHVHRVSKKTVPTYFLLLVCQIWTNFNKNWKECPGINP